jgi:3-oxoacyl-[acyl-carrier-protein] synthase II
MKRRVAITGMGTVTALGEGAASLWEAALAGRSGIDYRIPGGASGEWNPIGGYIRQFAAEKYVPQRKAIKVMARDIQLAVAAAHLAVHDAAAASPEVAARDRFGVIVGSGVLNHEVDELAYSIRSSVDEAGRLDLKKFGDDGLSALFPLWLLKYLPNMPACHISIFFDLQGPNNTITAGASSGLQAVGEAYRIIQRGSADVMLAGGAESKLNPVGLSHYEILGVLAHADGDPKAAYKPFDGRSRGFVAGEGAAFLVLEELEHARARGARIYAEMAGFGCSSAEGHRTAMRIALDEAKARPDAVDHLQACGLGLPAEDALEAAAIESVFGASASSLEVTASKPVTGFTGFTSGTLDLVFSAMSLRHQTAPPTLNFSQPAREFRFRIVKDRPLRKRIDATLTNSFGFGGQCASAALRRCEEAVS